MMCRVSQSRIKPIISFGRMPIANGFLENPRDREYFYRLSVSFCPVCYLVQLGQIPQPQQMFNAHYAYISSTSKNMADHFKKQAHEILRFTSKRRQPFVLELGSNDGIMLKHVANAGIRHLGIEPSENVAKESQKYGVNALVDFFSLPLARKIAKTYGKADVICASNTLCSVANITSAFSGFAMLLKDDGMVFFEDPYLMDIIKLSSFDQIYDEHIFYFSVLSVNELAKKFGFQLVDVKHQSVHGGSMRYYLKKGEHPVSPRVRKFLALEKRLSLDRYAGYKTFAQRVKQLSSEVRQLLIQLRIQKKQVIGYGATSKSTTLLNYSSIGPDLITYIVDNTPTKIGTFTPGTHIPIKTRELFLNDQPDYTLLLAWNHRREILKKEYEYLKKGGKFITYFPKVRIWSKP